MREGNIYTWECLSVHHRWGVPHPRSDGGGGVLHPRSDGGGYPIPGLDGGGRGYLGYYPRPGLDGGGYLGYLGTPQARSGWWG